MRSHIFFLGCCPPSYTIVNTTNVALVTEPETLLEAAHLGVSGPLWGLGPPHSPATHAQAAEPFSALGYHSNTTICTQAGCFRANLVPVSGYHGSDDIPCKTQSRVEEGLPTAKQGPSQVWGGDTMCFVLLLLLEDSLSQKNMPIWVSLTYEICSQGHHGHRWRSGIS